MKHIYEPSMKFAVTQNMFMFNNNIDYCLIAEFWSASGFQKFISHRDCCCKFSKPNSKVRFLNPFRFPSKDCLLRNFMRKNFELFNDNSKVKTFYFWIIVKQLSFFRAKNFADRYNNFKNFTVVIDLYLNIRIPPDKQFCGWLF